MKTLTWMALGSVCLSACSDKPVTGGGYDLSDVENPGESLDEEPPAEDDEDTDDDDDSDDTGEPDEPDEPTVDERTFGMKLVVSTLMPGVFDSSLEEVLTIPYILVDWRRTGLDIEWTETLCDISSTEAHDAQTSFPAAFVSSTPIRERTATLSAAETGATFESDPYLALDGVELSDPWTDSLPTSAADSRLDDRDADGHPGVTIHVDAGIVAGNVYVAQRSEYQLSGLVIDHDRVEAYVDYNGDQSIVGASNVLLTMAEVTPVTNPDPSASYVIFQQLDDDAGCGDVDNSIF